MICVDNMYLQKCEISSERQGRFCISQKNSNLSDINTQISLKLPKQWQKLKEGNGTIGSTGVNLTSQELTTLRNSNEFLVKVGAAEGPQGLNTALYYYGMGHRYYSCIYGGEPSTYRVSLDMSTGKITSTGSTFCIWGIYYR